MNCEETRLRVADELFGGARAGNDNTEIEDHLKACASCRTEAEAVRATWARVGAVPDPEPSRAVEGRFYAALHAYEEAERAAAEKVVAPKPRGSSWWRPSPAWQAALGTTCLTVGLVTGSMLTARRSGSDAGRARTGVGNANELAQLRQEISGMRQMVTLSLLQQQSATERLRGVTWSYQAQPDDVQILSALLHTLNTDPSVDVRLAAVESLKKLSQSSVARRGLENSLLKQESPLVQISVVDALLEIRDKNAGPALRTLASHSPIDPNVKSRIDEALRLLQ